MFTVSGQIALQHPLTHIVGGDRFSQPDYGALGGAVDEAVRYAFLAIHNRGNFDDATTSARNHRRFQARRHGEQVCTVEKHVCSAETPSGLGDLLVHYDVELMRLQL